MRGVPILLIGTLLAGCSSVPPQPAQRTAEQQAKYARLTNGLVAGPGMTCVPSWRTQDMTIIDGHTVGFSQTASNVTIVTLSGGCESLSTGAYAMQTKTSGMGLCTGDIVQVIDTMNRGFPVGSCGVVSIVPYGKPR